MLTDVVMPEMSGHELARRLESSRPALKVIYMSGAMDEESFRELTSDPRLLFIQKPFSLDILGHKLKEILGPEAMGNLFQGKD